MIGPLRAGRKISLVPRLPEHVEDIHHWVVHDLYQDVYDFYSTFATTLEELESIYDRESRWAETVMWSIVRNRRSGRPSVDGDIIGFVEIQEIWPVGRGAIGSALFLVPWERGKGYGTEAATLRTAYAFDTLNLERLETRVDSENVAMQRVLESVGYRRSGHRRHYVHIHDRWRDAYTYELLRDEWRASQRERTPA